MSKTNKGFKSQDGKVKPPVKPTSTYTTGSLKSRVESAVKPPKKK